MYPHVPIVWKYGYFMLIMRVILQLKLIIRLLKMRSKIEWLVFLLRKRRNEWHSRGQRFDPAYLHHIVAFVVIQRKVPPLVVLIHARGFFLFFLERLPCNLLQSVKCRNFHTCLVHPAMYYKKNLYGSIADWACGLDFQNRYIKHSGRTFL